MKNINGIVIKVLRTLWNGLKIVLLVVLALEVISFAAMTVHNYILYGNVYSHVPVRYDPNTLFLMRDTNPSSEFNSVSNDPQLNRIVWMFGGSTVRCNAHWDPNQTLPALVSKFLNQKARPYHFTVVNFGENGFNSLLESKYFQKAIADSHEPPNLVIFYDGANDCFQYAEYREPEGHVGYRRLKGFIEGYRMSWFGIFKPISAAVYTSYTNEFIDRFRMLGDPVDPDSPNLDKMALFTARRFDHVAKVANCYSSEFLLLWQPVLWVENCQVGEAVNLEESTMFLDARKFPDLKQSVETTYNKLEHELLNKPYFVSLRNSLCGRQTACFQPDGIHLTCQGNEEMAQRIAELIIGRFRDTLISRAAKNWDQSFSGAVQ
ncbi:MAG: SGNH/GDSL hydrolase family protein [Pseudomonadota bacterium]